MQNKRENKAIKGKSEMITICFRSIIPVKKRIFILLSLAGSVLWGGLDPEIMKYFTLIQSVEQKCTNLVEPFEKKLAAGDLLWKAKRRRRLPHTAACSSQKCNSYFYQTLI